MLPVALAAMLAFAPSPQTTGDPKALAGSWTVDLSVDPTQPYSRPMRLALAEDGTLSGLFYQSEIDGGRWRAQNGRLCVIFRTHDDNGPYHTSGCLEGDHVTGQTWAENRNFIFLWRATRATE